MFLFKVSSLSDSVHLTYAFFGGGGSEQLIKQYQFSVKVHNAHLVQSNANL